MLLLVRFETNEHQIGNRGPRETEHVGRVSKLDVSVEKQNSKCRIENSRTRDRKETTLQLRQRRIELRGTFSMNTEKTILCLSFILTFHSYKD